MKLRGISLTLIVFLFQALSVSIVSANEFAGLEVILSIDSPKQGQLPFSKGLANTSTNQVSLIQQRRVAQTLPKQRAPLLAEGRLVVVALDAAGKEISRDHVLDPRWLRSELPNTHGQLNKLVLKQAQGQFPVLLPNDNVAQLKIFEPVWRGSAFDLQLIGAVNLAGSTQAKETDK